MLTALKRLRQERGLTQKDLADRAGWSDRVATVSDLETGKANPTLSTIEQIAGALGVPVRDLFEPQDDGDRSVSAMLHGLAKLDLEDRELLFRLAKRMLRGRAAPPQE